MLFQKPTYDWLIAGLGNPGPEYEKTRHNTGFMSLDLLASRLQVKVSKERFKALTAQADYVLRNDSSLAHLQAAAEQLCTKLLAEGGAGKEL